MKLKTPSAGERSAKSSRTPACPQHAGTAAGASAKRCRESASGSAEPNPTDVTDSLRDGSPCLPPIPDFPKVLPQEDDPWAYRARTGLVDVEPGAEALGFTPVPRLRNRRNGWTEQTQRLFILALGECGCVSKAARAVGMSVRSAYRLLEADGAESFADAWDQAIARGIERLRAEAFESTFSGAWVPVYRRGRLVRVEHRRNDRLAIALLSGRNGSVADNRERAASRRKHRRKLLADRKAEAEKRRQAEAVWAEHEAVLERIAAEERNPVPRPIACPPRIRRL